jgi:hypothetical protein
MCTFDAFLAGWQYYEQPRHQARATTSRTTIRALVIFDTLDCGEVRTSESLASSSIHGAFA